MAAMPPSAPFDDDFIDLPALLGAAAAAAMASQQSGPFLEWLRENITHYATPDSPLTHDEELRRAFTTSLGRALWNAMPLPRRQFRTDPIGEPGRNDLCPCGSGSKFKHCCAQAPSLGPFNARLLWPFVLRALSGPAREAALRSPHLAREAILEYAAEEIESGRSDAAVALLEPLLADPVQREDDVAAEALDLLCNAYDERGGAKRRKQSLLDRISARPARSPLRSAANQRLACIYMDRDQPKASWAAFRSAQQDDPGHPALGMLEVQLLLSEGRNDEARDRARFFLAQLRRRGGDLDPRLIGFYESLATDPGRAMSDVAFEVEQGAGRRLADWLDRVRSRPLPVYSLVSSSDAPDMSEPEALAQRLRQMGLDEPAIKRAIADLKVQLAELEAEALDGTGERERAAGQSPEREAAADWLLGAPASVSALERSWHAAFPFPKPFSVHPLPWTEEGPWLPAAESRWMSFLERHPEAFDSLDVLDDLATATMMHAQSVQSAVSDRLLRPLLDRSVAIFELALAEAASGAPTPRLRWLMTENRPVLRSLFRAHEDAAVGGRSEVALRLAERLLALNPDDNHGVRFWLASAYLKANDPEACLRVARAYPDDHSPELSFNAALALYRLGRARSATEALETAHGAAPRVTRFLLSKRVRRPELSEHGVTLDGDDRGWLYREDMRGTWLETPGAIAWASKVLGVAGG